MQKEFNNNNFSLLLSNIENNKDGSLLSNTFSNIQKIDRGGFGILYKARHILDLKEYAIKKISLLKENDDVFCVNIYNKLKEVRCLSALNHKNIVRYNTSWIENIPNLSFQEINIYIQMELMDLNLKDYLTQNKKITLNCKKNIVENIILGINYLHSQKIIHCDLKPDNILLNLQNEIIKDVKIADFGLVIEKNLKKSVNIEYGNYIYIPPDSYENYTIKYDVYSLSIIIFEILENWETNTERIEKILRFKSGFFQSKYPILTKMVSEESSNRPDMEYLENNLSNLFR